MRYSIKSILSVAVLGGALGAGLMLSAAPASALTVDGELSDWGHYGRRQQHLQFFEPQYRHRHRQFVCRRSER